MSRLHQAQRLNVLAFAQEAQPLNAQTPLQNLARLAQETQQLPADATVQWEARAELRPQTGGEDVAWLHLQAATVVPLTCQRCMAAVDTPLEVDQWYRFVADEDIAMAEDDESEEDLLVLEPQFDLQALLEDELLMALPLVPMHEVCPVPPVLQAGEIELPPESGDKPNPFAVLASLKGRK